MSQRINSEFQILNKKRKNSRTHRKRQKDKKTGNGRSKKYTQNNEKKK
jgi:hypothetical protein